MEKVIQPSDISVLIGCNCEDVEKIMSSVISVLVYMKPGESLKSSSTILEKIDNDLIHIDSEISVDRLLDTIDFLEKKNVIKFPV